MKTPGIFKTIKETINPAEWVKGGIKETGEQLRAGINENTYSQEESADQTTTRANNDMQSDSWLSKNVRPIAFLHFLVLLDLLIFGQIEVQPWATDIIKTSFWLILGWYFGERAVLKILREVRKSK